MDVNVDLFQWFKVFLIKKSSGSEIEDENISDQQLAEELQKPIIRELKKRKLQSDFIDNICGADYADMQLINEFNKACRFLL